MHYHHGVNEDARCPYTRLYQPADPAPFGANMEAQALAVKRKLEFYKKSRDVGEVVCLWECEFDQMLKDDKDLQRFLSNLPYPPERLRIRTGLRGGRTETFRNAVHRRAWAKDVLH